MNVYNFNTKKAALKDRPTKKEAFSRPLHNPNNDLYIIF